MHTVRVYSNHQEGTRWWAEDDLGFTGGADRLSDLLDKVREWMESEDVLDALSIEWAEDTSKGRTEANWSEHVEVIGLKLPQSGGAHGAAAHAGPVLITHRSDKSHLSKPCGS